MPPRRRQARRFGSVSTCSLSSRAAPFWASRRSRDISRQKETEERLRRSEADHRSLVQEAAFGIYRSTEDGRILDANPALAQMLGYDSVDEVLTHNMLDLYRSPEDRAALLATGA